MSDVIDRAQHYDEVYRESAIVAHFADRSLAAARPAAVDCIDCGEEIPAARRKAAPGAIRCVGCQDRHERTYGRQS